MRYERSLDELMTELKNSGGMPPAELKAFVAGHDVLASLQGTIVDYLKGKGYIKSASSIVGANYILTLDGHRMIEDGGFVSLRLKDEQLFKYTKSSWMWARIAGIIAIITAFVAVLSWVYEKMTDISS